MKRVWLGLSIALALAAAADAASPDHLGWAIDPSGSGARSSEAPTHARGELRDRQAAPRAPRAPCSASSANTGLVSRYQLMAVGWYTGALYDVDLATATLSNPRPTGIVNPSGLAISPDGKLYASYAFVGLDPAVEPGLYTIDDPALGAATPLGPAGLDYFIEGDIDFDPLSCALYGLWSYDATLSTRVLLTFDRITGAAAVVANIDFFDPSCLAFDASGTMYVFDHDPDVLHVVDPATATVIRTTPLRSPVNSIVAGMDFDPTTGKLYLATGVPDPFLPDYRPPALYEIDPVTGDVIEIGPLDFDISGLGFVPMP